MRRLSTITLTVIALIAMALPASAGKGGNKPPKDSNYKGTCAAAGYDDQTPGHPGDVVTDSFTVTVGGRGTDYLGIACVDVLPAKSGPWTISVSNVSTGTAPPRFGDLNLIVRDSVSPGDICDFRTLEGTIGTETLSDIPDATVNACDPEPPADAWAELIHEYTGEQGPAPWDANGICQQAVETDAPCLVIGPMLDSVHPLAFQAAFSGSRNAAVEIHVTLP
ncbi:MAG: hypothetical protein HKN80_08145 [Acidimicrobiia bacterium]|nr:hypothetical protein [Acidimicrobiia bacterium]